MKRKRKKQGGDAVLSLLYMLRAALIAGIATAALMLLVAILLKWEFFPMTGLNVLNTFIKTLCSALAGYCCNRFSGGEHAINAGGAGVIYILLSYVVFRLIEGEFAFRTADLADVALAFTAALAAALITNLIRNPHKGNEKPT